MWVISLSTPLSNTAADICSAARFSSFRSLEDFPNQMLDTILALMLFKKCDVMQLRLNNCFKNGSLQRNHNDIQVNLIDRWCSLSGILKITQCFANWICFHNQVKRCWYTYSNDSNSNIFKNQVILKTIDQCQNCLNYLLQCACFMSKSHTFSWLW